jgi:hypothetical protein
MPSQRLSESDINPKRRRIASESRRCGHCNKYRSHSAFTKPGDSEILMCSDCRVCTLNPRISDRLLMGYRCVVIVNGLLQPKHLLVMGTNNPPLLNTLLERRIKL